MPTRETLLALRGQLKRGLDNLGPDYRARLCGVCGGAGEYEQTYNAGCGRGYFRSMGRCDHCDGTGLIQAGRPAPASVIQQVRTAALTSQEATHG